MIGAPNPKSLSGIVTKYSPHWFHVWFYRHVMGEEHAGEPGPPPFQTLFHPLVEPSGLVASATARGMDVVFSRQYESPRYPEMREYKPLFAAAIDALSVTLNLFVPRRIDVRRGDYHVILRKP